MAKATVLVISKILGDLEDLEVVSKMRPSDVGRQAKRLRVLIKNLGFAIPESEPTRFARRQRFVK